MKTVVIFDKGIEGRECRFDENNFMQDNSFGPGTVVLGLDGKVYENYGTDEKPFWEEVFDASYEVSTQDVPAIEDTITLRLKEDPDPNTIHFRWNDTEEVILKISKEGFYYRGELVEDIHNVYERFNEWLTKVE